VSGQDRARWDARYGAAVDVAPVPPDVLRGREELVPRSGRALDVACGRGAVAIWLARRGLSVDAVDVSPVALAAGAAAEPSVTWIEHDLDRGLPPGGPYAVVVCQRFRDPALYPGLAARLAPGGLLAVTVLSEVGDVPGPFRAPAGELLEAFSALDVLAHREGDGEASLLAVRPAAPRGGPRPRPTPS
jgi:SAM-dependent methyltransferase